MRVISVPNPTVAAKVAAKIIGDQVERKSHSFLGLATGGSVVDIYKELVSMHASNKVDFRRIVTANLDSYVGPMPLGYRDQSYRAFMRQHLFDPLELREDQTHFPDGEALDLNAACAKFESALKILGKRDIQLLGIGENGHIAFNEPGTIFQRRTHVVELTPNTRSANARFFGGNIDLVPTHAITMGIATIIESERILMIATGEKKSWAVRHLLEGTNGGSMISKGFPASVLWMHQDVTVVIDTEAREDLRRDTLCGEFGLFDSVLRSDTRPAWRRIGDLSE